MFNGFNGQILKDCLYKFIPERLEFLFLTRAMCYFCFAIINEKTHDSEDVVITFDDYRIVNMRSVFSIANPIIELGLIYCRGLLDFLGIRLNTYSGKLFNRKSNKTDDLDIIIEDFHLNPVFVNTLPLQEKNAFAYIIETANKYVTHFTLGTYQDFDYATILYACYEIGQRVNRHLYQRLGINIPKISRIDKFSSVE